MNYNILEKLIISIIVSATNSVFMYFLVLKLFVQQF